jgi:hypothetical protein
VTVYVAAVAVFFVCVSLFMLGVAGVIVTINVQLTAIVGAIAGFVCAIIRVAERAKT